MRRCSSRPTPGARCRSLPSSPRGASRCARRIPPRCSTPRSTGYRSADRGCPGCRGPGTGVPGYRLGMVSTAGPVPRCAVPVAVPPLPVSAVITLVPAEASGAAADQVRPSGEVHSTACRSPAGPASPTATNPLLVAVTPVTVAVAPLAREDDLGQRGAGPGRGHHEGDVDRARGGEARRHEAAAGARRDGLQRRGGRARTAWQGRARSTAGRPPTSRSCGSAPPRRPRRSRCRPRRRRRPPCRCCRCWRRLPSRAGWPTTRRRRTPRPRCPACPPPRNRRDRTRRRGTARPCGQARSARAAGTRLRRQADQKATGAADPPSIAEPTAIHPAGPWATEVRCPVSPPNTVADTSDHAPPAACRQTAGWPFA